MENKPKLLYVVEAMGGGVFTYIVDLANELVKTYDIYIAYAVRPQTPKNYKDYFNSKIHLIEVKNFIRSIGVSKDIKAFFEIRNISKDINPDIVHLHSSKAGVLGRLAFNGRKIPLFYTPHGYSFLMVNCGLAKKALYKTIEAVLAKRSCTTISCSAGEHQETLKLTNHSTYVDNGINMNELDGIIGGLPQRDHPFTVFTLGRICYQKNPELFNAIAKELPNVHFLWIGDGDLRNCLSAPNIEVTGWTDRKTALEKTINADAFILTSLWEGLPISLLEAMYLKKPCIVSDVIGNHDVIHNGINGYVCSEVVDFINAIHKVKKEKSEDMIEKAYSDILNQYNTTQMAEKYNEIYQGG